MKVGVMTMADLIDRAALLERLGNIPEKLPTTVAMRNGKSLYQAAQTALWAGADYVINAIKAAPAVDVVEVKYGHWQEYEDYCLDVYYACSVCDGLFYMADGTPTENGYNFCPKCGARMGETIRVELENDEID